MAKIPAEQMDIKGILDRMVNAAGVENFTVLAEKLGLSAQALSQTRERQSISLPLMMRAAKLCGTSIDYLLFGTGYGVVDGDTSEYIEVPRLGAAGGYARVLLELLPRGIDDQDLTAYIYRDKLRIIDKSDREIATDGTYALGDPDHPLCVFCKKTINGIIMIEGETPIRTPDELAAVNVIGRVVWEGARVD